jgi:hypothetical protein
VGRVGICYAAHAKSVAETRGQGAIIKAHTSSKETSMPEEDRFSEVAPLHVTGDTRTMVIAGQQAQFWSTTMCSIQAAMLAALASSLHETGALPMPAIVALTARWTEILSSWPGSPELKQVARFMATALQDEMSWQLPGIAPPSTGKPTRVGRKRRQTPRHPPAEE